MSDFAARSEQSFKMVCMSSPVHDTMTHVPKGFEHLQSQSSHDAQSRKTDRDAVDQQPEA